MEKSESLQHGGTWKELRSAVCLPVAIEMHSSVHLICSLENTVSSHCPIFARKNHGVSRRYVGEEKIPKSTCCFHGVFEELLRSLVIGVASVK